MVFSGNQQLLRTLNRLAVLRAIRRYPGISRVQLAEQLGLTRPTIGNLVEDLIETKWLREVRQGPTGSLGRRPVALYIDNDSRSVIGADVSGERIICVATTLGGEIRGMRISPPLPFEEAAVSRGLAESISLLWERMDRDNIEVSALGIGIPEADNPWTASDGPLNTNRMNELLFNAIREKNLGMVPILVQESVNCRAIHHFESCPVEEQGPLLYLYAGQTVAAALSLEGALLHGRHGKMGNIGHYILDPSGPPCLCGRIGCANAMTTLSAIQTATGYHTENLKTAVNAGAPAAISALRQAGFHFGRLAYNLCAQFDPARIYVDGPVFEYGDHYLHAARESFDQLIRWEGQTAPALEPVRHEANAVALGAAIAALQVLMHPV